MARCIAALLFTVLAGVGCKGAAAPPLTPPEEGGPAWTKFTSPHFLVRTDLPARDAFKMVEELERLHATLADVAFPFAVRPAGRTSVLVLRDQAEMDMIGPLGAAGFFRPGSDDGGALPSLCLRGALTGDARRLALHELTHRFVNFYYPGAPRWVNEGLAQYYSTLEFDAGKVVLGRPLDDLLFRVGNEWQTEQRGHRTFVWVATNDVPGVAQLLAGGPQDFMRRTDEPDLAAADSRRVAANYAGAWALVHMLKSSPEPYPVGFDAFLLGISAGEPAAHAWREAFAGSEAQLELDYQKYLRRTQTMVLRAAYEPPAGVVEQQQTMSPAEVHLFWAGIRGTLAAKRLEVGAAKLLAPGDPEVALWRGRLAALAGDADGAERFLREAVAARPDDERYMLALFRQLRRDTGSTVAAADAAAAQLRRLARSSGALNDLAWFLLARGRPDEALPLAIKAIETNASCYECYDTLAAVYFARGDATRAFASQTIALNVRPDGARDEEMVKRWEQYRDARPATPP